MPPARGCDACRKQKKKCDQRKPACSRCLRLQVACVGAGQLHIKFVAENYAVQQTNHVTDPNSVAAQRNYPIILAPCSDSTVLVSAFVSALEASAFQTLMPYYGEFLGEIPRRLGSSLALDAAAGALTSALPAVSGAPPSVKALRKYGKALHDLRKCLSDPSESKAPDMLCAIYFMMITEGWLGRKRDFQVSHAAALAQLFINSDPEVWKEVFDFELLVTLCVPIILESLQNPDIRLDLWFLQLSRITAPPIPRKALKNSPTSSTITLNKLARIASLLRQPELHPDEVESVYQDMRAEHERLRDYVQRLSPKVIDPEVPMSFTLEDHSKKLVDRYHLMFAIMLAISAILSDLLRARRPNDQELAAEAATITDDILQLAANPWMSRPFGAMSMPVYLIAAWSTTPDPLKQREVEDKLATYSLGFAPSHLLDYASWSKVVLEKKRARIAAEKLEPGLREGDFCAIL